MDKRRSPLIKRYIIEERSIDRKTGVFRKRRIIHRMKKIVIAI